MIAFLSGKLIEKQPTFVLLNVQGVGYEVLIPVSTYDQLPALNATAEIRTYMHVREDALQLFGFATHAEKIFFLDLIGVSGIGPKVALGILSASNYEEFQNAIAQNDIIRLKSLPGIGKKTAERLVLELKDKYTRTVAISGAAVTLPAGELLDDAVMALVSLGYSKPNVVNVLTKLIRNEKPENAESLIKLALRHL